MRTAQRADGTPVPAAAFLAAAAKPHRRVVRVDVLRRGETIHESVDVAGGRVSVDRIGQFRSHATGITFPAPPGTVPTAQGGVLAPAGFELRIWVGMKVPGLVAATVNASAPVLAPDGSTLLAPDGAQVVYSAGTGTYGTTTPDETWLVPVFTGPIWTAKVNARGIVTVDAWDRAKLLSKAKLAQSFAMTTSETLETRLAELLDIYPWFGAGDWSGGTHPAPAVVHERGSDPWQTSTDHAAAVGYELFFDGWGQCKWRPEPNLSTATPVRTVSGAGLVDIDVDLDREPVVGEYVVVGSNTDAGPEIVGVATNTDPTSLTYPGGPFGMQREVVTDSLVATLADAEASAAARLAATAGLGADISYSTTACPIVEPGDAELVQWSKSGIDQVVIVDGQDIDLAPGVQQHTAQARVRTA